MFACANIMVFSSLQMLNEQDWPTLPTFCSQLSTAQLTYRTSWENNVQSLFVGRLVDFFCKASLRSSCRSPFEVFYNFSDQYFPSIICFFKDQLLLLFYVKRHNSYDFLNFSKNSKNYKHGFLRTNIVLKLESCSLFFYS